MAKVLEPVDFWFISSEEEAAAATFSTVIEMRGFWRLNVILGVQPKAPMPALSMILKNQILFLPKLTR